MASSRRPNKKINIATLVRDHSHIHIIQPILYLHLLLVYLYFQIIIINSNILFLYPNVRSLRLIFWKQTCHSSALMRYCINQTMTLNPYNTSSNHSTLHINIYETQMFRSILTYIDVIQINIIQL